MKKELFVNDWYVRREGSDRDESKKVTLPYDCMIHEKRDPLCVNSYNSGYYPGGSYVYEKSFFVDSEDDKTGINNTKKQYIFHFDGVYRNAAVMINGELVSTHRYGYGEFDVNATPYIRYGEDNVIEVHVNNSDSPNSRWYSGSGIIRNVWLCNCSSTHIVYHGLFVKTLSITDDKAVIEGNVSVAGSDSKSYVIETTLFYDGKEVFKAQGDKFTGEIINPILWSDKTPNLYDAKVTLTKDGNVIDEHTCKVGLRTIEYSHTQGLVINGKRVFLNGGCLHHDNGILGAVSTDESEERRVRIMKKAGFNAIRSAHNPISPALLKACDKLGMYIMDEAFDMWFSHKTKYDFASGFRSDWQEELSSMVIRDRNHPSVIMYSMGNEIIDIASNRAIEMSKRLCDVTKSLDDTRPTTICANVISASVAKTTDAPIEVEDPIEHLPGANTLMEGPLVNRALFLVEVVWSHLVYTDLMEKKFRDVFSCYDIVGYNYASNGPVADRKKGRNRLSVASETYPHDIIRNYNIWKHNRNTIGDFVWTGIDYIGEAIVGDWNYGKDVNRGLYKEYPALLAGCGQIDITGHITPMARFRTIVTGQRRKPFITVRPLQISDKRYVKSIWKTYDGQDSWSWNGYEGKKAIVQVLSRDEYVEIYLNDSFVGKSNVKNYCAQFELPYERGTLRAVSYDSNGVKKGEHKLTSADDDIKLTLKIEDEASIKKGGLVYVNISLTDMNGIVHAAKDRIVNVNVESGGELVALGCARAENFDSFDDNKCHTYFGRALAIIRLDDNSKNFKVKVSSGDLVSYLSL